MITFLVDLGRSIIALFADMAPYLLLGLTVAGLLDTFVKRSFVARHIGRRGIGSVVKSSLLGVPLPLCSCGVVPTASYLRRAGASKPATMSFLISTPQTGVDSIAATYGMLGPLFAVFRPLAALVTGVAGGIFSMLAGGDRESTTGAQSASAVAGGTAETRHASDRQDEARVTVRERVRHFLNYAFVESIDDIALRFIFGLVVAGLVTVVLPDDFFAGRAIGSGLSGMLLMVAVGIPMYVCSTSSIPIAVALIAKGLSPGAAYVFLVAGPATNAATLAVFSSVLGRRQTIVYVATLIAGSLAFGPAMNALANAFGWTPPSVETLAMNESAGWLNIMLAVALGTLILVSIARLLYRKVSARQSSSRATASERGAGDRRTGHESDHAIVIRVKGMTCTNCAATVRQAAETVPSVDKIDVNLASGELSVHGPASRSDVAEAVRQAGYDPV